MGNGEIIMKVKKLIYVFAFILITSLLTAYHCYAEPTVKEILEKVAQSTQKQKDNIQDLSCNQTVILLSPSGNQVVTISDLYVKGDKQKNIVYDDEGNVLQTQILNGEEMTVIDYKGQVFTSNLGGILSEEDIAGLKQQLDTVGLPASLDYETNPTGFIQEYTVTIDNVQSDPVNDIYVLSVKNIHPDTQEELPNDLFHTMEITIDYNKGVVLEEKMYNDAHIILTHDTFTDYEKFGVESNDFWYSKTKIEKTIVDTDQYFTKTVKHENIEFNQDLGDDIFQ